ncbi:MAG TPA: transposase [Caldithrix abyssi]|uniref:Transposase n=1 Tax=Caldithrix abyssi TaxID=187145 RepID=A0A7V5H512_CALAY|nr:transposase [Caldithrix abyssi]
MLKEKESLRQKAVELYEKQVPVTTIVRQLGKSKSWFYKWLKRYRTRDNEWYKEDSKRPKKRNNKTSREIELLVVETRKRLEGQPYHQYGPQAIFYELKAQGIDEPPPVWAIARILKRYDMVKNKSNRTYQPKGRTYLYSDFILCHQMDYIGPRYLKGGQGYYAHTIICQDSHFAQAIIQDNCTSHSTCENLIRFWKKAGIPDFLQMDNSISFWGSLRKPTALGKVIRLCLLYRVIPIFIPVREPWRNGIIEHFNRTFQSAVLSRNYTNINELKQSAKEFCEIHNRTHHYSSQEGMTPNQRMALLDYPLKKVSNEYKIPNYNFELEEGEIYVIRLIRSDLKFHLFGLSFKLPDEVQYEYVLGVILTVEHKLKIFKEQKCIAEFPFKLF